MKKNSAEEGVAYFIFGLNGEVLYEEEGEDYTEYVFVMGQHFAFVEGTVSSDGSEKKTYFYLVDQLGSTMMITNEDGQILWQDEATPFGESSGESGHMHYSAKFTGKDMDEETGLYYFNARWYDPSIGRFMSKDTAKDGVNWFIYCRNNPLKWVDITGCQAFVKVQIGFRWVKGFGLLPYYVTICLN
jgi:RHS repeat-associated protein